MNQGHQHDPELPNQPEHPGGHDHPAGGPAGKAKTSMIEHGNATARLSFYGLSLMLTNKKEEYVEIGFVRDMHAPVTIKVFKDERVIDSYTCPSGKFVNIEIAKTNRVGVGKLYQNEPRDLEDFRWMPDLSGWHGERIAIRKEAKDKLSAKLKIWDAEFYTREAVDGNTLVTFPHGRVVKVPVLGRILGADMECGDTDDFIGIRVLDDEGRNLWTTKIHKDEGQFGVCLSSGPQDTNDHLPMIYSQIVDQTTRFSMEYEKLQYGWDCDISPAERIKRLFSDKYACQIFYGGEGTFD